MAPLMIFYLTDVKKNPLMKQTTERMAGLILTVPPKRLVTWLLTRELGTVRLGHHNLSPNA